MRRHNKMQLESPDTAQQVLIVRARRFRAKGETRKALVAIREACLRDDTNAAIWTSYGALLARAARRDDAVVAFSHALWLRRRSHDEARARSTQLLIDRLSLPSAA
jgi:Flp pilus assembly protein TadD